MWNKLVLQLILIKFILCTPETISKAQNNDPISSPSVPPLNPFESTTEPEAIEDDDPPAANTDENFREFWQASGQRILKETLKRKVNMKKAKNLIIFVADGMSIPTQTAARMYMGGEDKVLSFEEFPSVGLAKTYCVNYQVPDSACTATAFLSGIKTNFGVLSMSANVPLRNCSAETDESNHVDSIFKFAQDAKKATGIVTTSRVTHATVAAAYAKSASRYWESDSMTPEGCKDLADQLVHGDIGKHLDVILGGGYREFLPNNTKDPQGRTGWREDGRDLIRDFITSQRRVWLAHDRASLNSPNVNHIDKLLGLFSESHMQYHLFNDKTYEPTLMDMTKKALQVMNKNPNGYVLLVESARIDHAHHENRANLALAETVHFHEVVDYVRKQVNESETLMVVTADHSHTMSISGYPQRGNNILSSGDFSREDNMLYFTLSYANGMGFYDHFNESGRANPLEMNFRDPNFTHPAMVPLVESTHAGDDVGVYAVGPHSHLFTGVYEQHYIAHAMMYATCLGPEEFLKCKACSAAAVKSSFVFLLLSFIAKIATD